MDFVRLTPNDYADIIFSPKCGQRVSEIASESLLLMILQHLIQQSVCER